MCSPFSKQFWFAYRTWLIIKHNYCKSYKSNASSNTTQGNPNARAKKHHASPPTTSCIWCTAGWMEGHVWWFSLNLSGKLKLGTLEEPRGKTMLKQDWEHFCFPLCRRRESRHHRCSHSAHMSTMIILLRKRLRLAKMTMATSSTTSVNADGAGIWKSPFYERFIICNNVLLRRKGQTGKG